MENKKLMLLLAALLTLVTGFIVWLAMDRTKRFDVKH